MERKTVIGLAVAILTFCTAIIEHFDSILRYLHLEPYIDSIETRGWIGLAKITNVHEEEASRNGRNDASGAYVVAVIPGSPAETAGIKAGDIVLYYGNIFIDDARLLPPAIQRSAPGSLVTMRVCRGSREIDIRVKVSAKQ